MLGGRSVAAVDLAVAVAGCHSVVLCPAERHNLHAAT